MQQQMFAQHEAEDKQFFQEDHLSGYAESLNSQPIPLKKSVLAPNRRLKSPTKLRSARQKEITPHKMVTRKDRKTNKFTLEIEEGDIVME